MALVRDTQHRSDALLPQFPLSCWTAPFVVGRTVAADIRTYRRAPRGERVPGPIFIVGSPRSGTTFLGNALASVPGLSYHFEPIAIKAALPYVYLGVWSDARSMRLVKVVHALITAVHGDVRRTLVDKQPSAVFIVGALHRWFPTARFIFLLRDGRDVTASWAEKPWFQNHPDVQRTEPGGYRYGANPHFWVESRRIEEFRSTTTAHRCAWGWRRHVESWLDQRETIPEDLRFEIRYERMVVEPGRTASELASFLCLSSLAGGVLERGLADVDEGSVGRWRSSPAASDPAASSEIDSLLNSLNYT